MNVVGVKPVHMHAATMPSKCRKMKKAFDIPLWIKLHALTADFVKKYALN